MRTTVSAERHVKLFRNGRRRSAFRELELPGTDAVMRKEGERLVIEPARPRSLFAVLRKGNGVRTLL